MTFLTKIFENSRQNKLNKNCLQAAHDGDFKSALELLDQGANVNYVGTAREWGYESYYKVTSTLGHSAISKDNIKAFTILLDKGLDVNISIGGSPLLMYAIESRNEPAALALLARGADTSYVRQDLETPLSVAEANGLTQVAGEIIARQQPAVAAVVPEDSATANEVATMKPLALRKNVSP